MWAIALLLGLFALLILALCIPVDAVFHFDTLTRPRSTVRLVWLFGLVKIDLRRKGKKSVVKEKPAKARRKRRAGSPHALKILRIKGLLARVIRLVRDILRQLYFRKTSVDLRIGLDNPAETAMLFAAIGALVPLFRLVSHQHDISLRPSFPEAAFEGSVHGEVRLQPVRLVVPSLGFIFSKPALRLMKTMVSRKFNN